MKRTTFILTLLLSAVTMMAEKFRIGQLTFETTSDNEVKVVKADKKITNVHLNPTITYQGATYSVTSIGEEAFKGCKSLTSVTIPESVTRIGYGAFWGTALFNNPDNWEDGALYISDCLISVDYDIAGNFSIKEGTRIIADAACWRCSNLTSITIPNSVISIGWCAFFECSGLKSITIGNGVTSIEYGAFEGCKSLKSVTIPNSVTSIGEEAFWGCSGLTSVTIGNSVTIIRDEVFSGCSGLTSITIPESVTRIRGGAFYRCSGLTSITIPESIIEIEWDAFYGTALYNNKSNWKNGALYINDCLIEVSDDIVGDFNIKEGTRIIAEGAFYGCKSLTSITIPESVTSIGYGAFWGSVLYEKSNWEDGALYINDCLIEVSKKKAGNFSIKEGTRIIADDACWRCSNLTSITIPNSVTSIGYAAFYECKSLTSVTIGNSVTSIGDGAFADCSVLNSITIPNSVTSIGYAAFADCSSLTSVTIPNSVTSIGYGAFEGTALFNNPDSWEDGALYISDCLISVDYDIAGNFSIKEGTRIIADGAFAWCESLTSITIPNNVTSIGEGAFYGCSGLTSVTVPSYTKIADNAFPSHTQIIRK